LIKTLKKFYDLFKQFKY